MLEKIWTQLQLGVIDLSECACLAGEFRFLTGENGRLAGEFHYLTGELLLLN